MVFLIWLSFFLINLYWILNFSPDYSSEDAIIFEQTIDIIKNKFSFLDIFTKPIVPIIISMGIKLYRNIYVPLIINSLFGLLLSLSVYGITKIIYGKKAGVFSSFLVLTTPIILGLSRTVYPEFILASLFSFSADTEYHWLSILQALYQADNNHTTD